MQCPHCRARIRDGDSYCGRCGHSLETNDESPAVRRHTPARREIAFLVGALGLVAAASLLAWYVLFRVRSPAAVVQAFIEADRRGDYTAAARVVSTKPDSRFVLSGYEALRRQATTSPFEQARFVGATRTGSTAEVTIEVAFAATPPTGAAPLAPVMTVPFQLVYEEGEWRIDAAATLTGVTGALLALGYQQLAPRIPSILPSVPGTGPFMTPPGATPPPARGPLPYTPGAP